MKKSTFYFTVAFILAAISLTASGAFSQTKPAQGHVFNLDSLDRLKTTNTAVFESKTFPVYQAKNGRLYFETGKLTKSGKPQRKYLTPAV